jgi:hypothetical protein
MMANPYPANRNNICGDHDHNRDGIPGLPSLTFADGDSLATQRGSSIASIPDATDDNYDYANFDFDQQAARVFWR